MSYKIEYKQGNNIKRLVRKEGKNTVWLLLILPIGAVCLRSFFPQTAHMIWNVLMPGFDEFSVHAISDMLINLRSGEPFGDAIVSFCQTIAGHAAA